MKNSLSILIFFYINRNSFLVIIYLSSMFYIYIYIYIYDIYDESFLDCFKKNSYRVVYKITSLSNLF